MIKSCAFDKSTCSFHPHTRSVELVAMHMVLMFIGRWTCVCMLHEKPTMKCDISGFSPRVCQALLLGSGFPFHLHKIWQYILLLNYLLMSMIHSPGVLLLCCNVASIQN